MKKHQLLLTIIFLILFVPLSYAQENLSGQQIQEKAIEATRLNGSESVATITILDGRGRERIRKVAQVNKLYDKYNMEKKLIRFLAPADVKDIGFLTFDYRTKEDVKWLYMPALRKTRRVVSSDNAKSFMGTEFSYADMTAPTVENFSYRILGEENINSTLCWKLEITPVNEDIADENGFSKKISFIGEKDFVIRKMIYYDLDEKLHKELFVHEIKEVDEKNHKFRIMHMEMENKQNGRKSILKVDQFQYSSDIKDDYFTIRYLERE